MTQQLVFFTEIGYYIIDTTKIMELGQIRKKAALTFPFCVCHFFVGEDDNNGRKIYESSLSASRKSVCNG